MVLNSNADVAPIGLSALGGYARNLPRGAGRLTGSERGPEAELVRLVPCFWAWRVSVIRP